ncbi:hypothetical protein K0C01_05240 [Salinarchaeum sp. IM2453]|uniref:hypothetical protein n=1 Tax=Salinarchaeum sp. IM2453 TaxID=2862870 RepID=UPI001C82FBA5|nr:hypothetical protein [Salinarchaeum sp. IM2453]QZA89537.1 hypothetical protein K0C01_05240 [Salinarchaeum sp. IM2453]
MEEDQLTAVLLDIGLPEREVEFLVEEYYTMQASFQTGEYEQVGIHVGKFSEGIKKLLQREIEETLRDETIRDFAQRYLDDGVDADVSEGIRKHIPNMLHTAWSIRSDRNAAHLNFDKPVRKADAQLGISLCSAMIVELVREFASEGDDIDRITDILEDLAEPVEENPLHSVVRSRTDFDRQKVANAIEGYIVVLENGEVERAPEFAELGSKQRVAALGLGRLVAYTLDYVDQIGVQREWFDDRSDSTIASSTVSNRSFILHDEELGGYYIPGHQAEAAISTLRDE